MTADPRLAEDVPTGAFGGPRPHVPDPEGPRRFAELARIVREIDEENGYGVGLRYRAPSAA